MAMKLASGFAGCTTASFDCSTSAPERLMLEGFLENVKRWTCGSSRSTKRIAISEWGHDFRRNYRQLATLRDHFPDAPLMALTATATERVREDIVKHLRLCEPRCYVASFNRPNLTYRVVRSRAPRIK